MIRILFYLAIVFLVGLGFAWLADRPGDMVVTFEGYQYRVSLMVAAVVVVAIVAAVMIAWWLLKAVWNSPYSVARYFRVRRRDRGYQALSTGMIAAGAGDAMLARKMNAQAAKLIRSDQEPLVHLLDAQASLLEGNHDAARKKFEAMLDDPEMRLLGLRGLYLEAERLGDQEAARHYAGRAADIAPHLDWAAESSLARYMSQGDWDAAVKLVDAQKASGLGDKVAAARRRCVLLTAKAMALMDTDPAGARSAALEANRIEPTFVPAALAAARVLFRNNDTRKGAKILEAAWKANPHPEIADLYTHARHGDAVNDRLTRAHRLRSIKQNHAESALAVARAEIDAHNYAAAREAAEAAIRMRPTEGAWLLLADIEELETGDVGKVRELLGRAVRAPRDPAWVADGYESEHWLPVSPVTGRLDAFEWRAPVERLGRLVEDSRSEPRKEIPAPVPATPVAPVQEASVVPPASVVVAAPPVIELDPATVSPVPAPVPANDAGQPVASPTGTVDPAPAPEEDKAPVADERSTAPAPPPGERSTAAEPEDAPIPPLPDDPGVDPSEEKTPRRFRLF
jgi:HemY protein